MQTVAARLSAMYSATNRNVGVLLKPLREQLVGSLRPTMLSLQGAVVLVLLVACANVANLLMVRATAARREVAIRQTLGASRSRLFLLFLTQTLVLCLLGGSLGVALAAGALPLLRLVLAHTNGLNPAMVQTISLNIPVLLFTLGVCTLTAVLFGLLPVIKDSLPLAETLRLGDRSSTERQRLSRGALVAAEVAIALMVVFLSALVIRSFEKLLDIDPGFRTDHLLSAEITLPAPRYTDGEPGTNHFYERLFDKIAQYPGVVSVASTNEVPLRSSEVMTRFLVEGAPPMVPGNFPMAQIRFISPGFFQTMNIRLLDGRSFEQREVESQSSLLVVNAAFAQRYLAGREPLGANILLGVMSPHPSKIPVIGVVADAHDLGVDVEPQPEIYLPGFGLHEVLLVRTAADPRTVVANVRDAVHSLEPLQPVYHLREVDSLLSDSIARQRMTAALLGIFAVVALLLAAVGIYGVLSYSVAQRTREIGVRMAVGARRFDVLSLVFRQAGGFVAAGIVLGLSCGLASARLISLINGLLFNTGAADPASIAWAVGALASVAALATCLPAFRAASVNPAQTLRAE
jgi:predicted permease